MKLGVIGAGALGGAVGRAWAKGGHEVILSSRHPSRLTVSGSGLRAASVEDCAHDAEVLLIATPYEALPDLGRQLRPQIAGKVVLDATNPDPFSHSELAEATRRNGMGLTSQKCLAGSRLVRAFSSINASAVTNSRGAARPLAVPVAGDDEIAVAIAERLVRDAGCVPVVTGDLASSRIFQWGNPGCFVNTDEAGLRKVLGL